ncbi:MAG: hypothetical protein JJE21_07580, partial [Spirochaetaceae bacterium]|nr:hypothetical protein [Spirochaetaceae bacterium]
RKARKNAPFETVFIGGGNPGSLSIKQLRELLINIGPSNETTFEINPESYCSNFEEYNKIFKEGLATRLSMGIQSVNDVTLKTLGRNATRTINLKALALMREVTSIKINRASNYFLYNNLYKEAQVPHIEHIETSLDLMSCIPGQSLEMAKTDINFVKRIANPNHISLYCLTVEEGTTLKNRVDDNSLTVMSDEEQGTHLNSLWEYLNQEGYSHYEISNFEKNDKECKHNMRYWNLDSSIGLGSHSASTLFNKKGELIRLYQDTTFNEYIKNELFTNYEREILDLDKRFEEYLIVALRTKEGLSKKVLAHKYRISNAKLSKMLQEIDRKYFSENEEFVFLNEKGFMLLDSITLSLSMAYDKLKVR